MGSLVGDKDKAAIERQVQPFMAIRRPRVGLIGPLEKVAILLTGCHPQAKRAIDMDPGTMLMCDPTCLGKGVEDTSIQIASLQANDSRRIGRVPQGAFELNSIHPAQIVTGHISDRVGPDAKKPD